MTDDVPHDRREATLRLELQAQIAHGAGIGDGLDLLFGEVDQRRRGDAAQGVADQLERGGYGSLLAIMKEADVDRMAIRTRIPHDDAIAIKKQVETFAKQDWPTIENGVLAARKEEIARREAEEAAAAEAEAAESPEGEQSAPADA